MIELVYSNMTERLLGVLAKDLEARRLAGAHRLEPVELVVPNRNMETWVRFGLAQHFGVAANLRFSWLNRFIGRIVAEACPGELTLVDLDTIEAAVLAALTDDDILGEKNLQAVKRYLENSGSSGTGGKPAAIGGQGAFDACLAADGADLRRVQLASRISFLFQEYSFSRPEMIDFWRSNGRGKLSGLPFADPLKIDPSLAPTVAWQRALWSAVFGSGGVLEQHPPAEGGRWATMDQLALDDHLFDNLRRISLPPVHIFGVSYMARLFQHLFARLGEISTLKIYSLNPCAEFWEDVETQREFFYRLDKELDRREKRLWNGAAETGDDDPFGLFQADTPALRYWGRPGREHVRLLGELTDCDFTGAFADPAENGDGLLHHLQTDILMREPERNMEPPAGGNETETIGGDQTVRLLAAPSVRREVEWVADEIWRLMREDKCEPPLRFSDVAIIVNSAGRDLYLPQIEAVFAACHNLPCSVSDLPGTAGSRMIEAMGLLLKLPFGRFSRSEMLSLIGHPAVIGRLDGLSPAELATMAESLGIIFGADHDDHAGTYIDEDVYNWDQGIRRLALGAFMTGDKSGDNRVYESDSGRWLVEETSGTALTAAARFGLLARSLLADARFIRNQKMTLSSWARFYTAQIDRYFSLEDDTDERDRLRLLNALGKLEKMDLGREVSGRIAAEIAARTLESLEGGRGQYLAEGVVVSSFLPMRAIPFRVVFLLGLGEGLFPASSQRDALDLRAARRRAGDVDPSERDRYMFLETLLCTRNKLYLSYVRRDELTGDSLQPSAVVQELLHMLKLGYLGEEGLAALRIEPPLRRYDHDFNANETFFDEALAEERVSKIALDWRKRSSRDNPEQAAEIFSEIKQSADPQTWTKLSELLMLTEKPSASATVTATGSFIIEPGDQQTAIETPISLPLSMLRRFLECPMQGWASAMLGLSEFEEDPADLEEEDFEVNRLTEIKLLNDLIYSAAASGSDPLGLYREKVSRLRLAGRIPVGSFGRVIEGRHLAIIEGWLSLLARLRYETDNDCAVSASVPGLQRFRFGQSGGQESAENTLPPLLLDIPLNSEGAGKRIASVRISGLVEGFFDHQPTTLVFQAKKPPKGRDINTLAGNFRYLLRGALGHALLSAAGKTYSGERQIVICYAGEAENTGMLKMVLNPPDAEQARNWLTEISAELLDKTHAYLLPCEAVFRQYLEGNNDPDINTDSLLNTIRDMAANEWAKFSSLWGPVPSPRLYEPPAPDHASEIIERRFKPLLSDIIKIEVLK